MAHSIQIEVIITGITWFAPCQSLVVLCIKNVNSSARMKNQKSPIDSNSIMLISWNIMPFSSVWAETIKKCGALCLSVPRFWKTFEQINNTPHKYRESAEHNPAIQVMSVAQSLAQLKLSRFRYEDKSETLSTNMSVRRMDLPNSSNDYKYRKWFVIRCYIKNHFWKERLIIQSFILSLQCLLGGSR